VIAPTLRSVKASKKLHLLLAARVLRRLAKKFAILVQGVLESPLMQGRKDQKHENETGNTVSGELDEQALTRDIIRFVEESDVSIPKIASEMGVLSATLTMWIAGTTKPSRRELLAIKSFLERRK
jgi:hypothetical protein